MTVYYRKNTSTDMGILLLRVSHADGYDIVAGANPTQVNDAPYYGSISVTSALMSHPQMDNQNYFYAMQVALHQSSDVNFEYFFSSRVGIEGD